MLVNSKSSYKQENAIKLSTLALILDNYHFYLCISQIAIILTYWLWYKLNHILKKITSICDPLNENSALPRNYLIRVRGVFIQTGHFPARLRLLHPHVTGGLHYIILNYETRLCYYKDTISLNSQAGQWNMGTRYYSQLGTSFFFLKKKQFQYVYGCLSVNGHNVSPHFHNHCLSQLSFSTFKLPITRTHVNFT